MTEIGPIERLRRLTTGERRLLVRASAMLGIARLAVATLPFRLAIRLGCGPIGSRSWREEDVVWAVEAAARRLPWRTVCIEKGLAVQQMLRSAGSPAILHYGAGTNSETGALEAHVWVTVNGRPVIGGDEAGSMALIASYGLGGS